MRCFSEVKSTIGSILSFHIKRETLSRAPSLRSRCYSTNHNGYNNQSHTEKIAGNKMGWIDFRKLATEGFLVCNMVLGSDVCNAIKREAVELKKSGHLKPAKVSLDRIRDPSIRGDNILWLQQQHTQNENNNNNNNDNSDNITISDNINQNQNQNQEQSHSTTLQTSFQPLLSLFESVRCDINRSLYLNIKHCEFQISHYPQGEHYSKHSDVSQKKFSFFNLNRVVTAIYYLNTDWKPIHGGELILYPEIEKSNNSSDNNENENENEISTSKQVIEPVGDRLVLFMSHLKHEVKTTNKDRYAFTCWFYS